MHVCKHQLFSDEVLRIIKYNKFCFFRSAVQGNGWLYRKIVSRWKIFYQSPMWTTCERTGACRGGKRILPAESYFLDIFVPGLFCWYGVRVILKLYYYYCTNRHKKIFRYYSKNGFCSIKVRILKSNISFW